ncbi:MAG: 23S rRNA (adenine(2503)-C(2))-methyltransferase RlmN [Candidatus Omnitrophica bacterium]|nr:23S rRNA (adenine(2503)-C(2))-methyltransferase RlmN [Candidatus Omnitrophota bacterium]
MVKQEIKNFTLGELEREIENIKEPSYRAKQIFFWIYKKGSRAFEEMDNIPEALRNKLKEKYCISAPTPVERLKSSDGTEKFLFRLKDGSFIESVLIPARDRNTVCLSTQVGCKHGCSFCASGLKGFVRNLDASEILNQILFLEYGLGCRITNFVFMGMGEPLDNYENVSKAISVMTEPEGMNISAKRITVSTCGIVPGIKALRTLKAGINLSVSLHAADDAVRSVLMPVNKKYPLKDLLKACSDFAKTAKGTITFEYVLIKGKNDSLKNADQLAAVAKKLNAKVNLLVYSSVPQFNFEPSAEKDIKAFMERLAGEKIKVTLRRSKGKDIAAACGQLAGRRQ